LQNEPASALMLAPETPYPVAGGGALRTASLLHYLARHYDVDLIVFREPGAPDPRKLLPQGLVRRVEMIALPEHRGDFLSRASRNLSRMARDAPPLLDRFAGFHNQVRDALGDRNYDVGVIEHFWCAPYQPLIGAACRRTLLDLHNIESQLHQRCAKVERRGVAFAHQVFHRACLDLERQWLPRFSEVLAPSVEDAGRARAIAPGARVSVYRNAIPWIGLPPHGDEEVVVFSGNMMYHPNQSAVRFFRDAVWPRLRNEWPALVWRLVGKNPEGVRRLVSGDPRIEVCGPVDDAVRELARARVAVVPLLAGSGTRLKILEAWAAGIPVVSTALGAEGLPVRNEEHLLLADGASAFAAAVSRLLACSTLARQLGMAGRLLLEKEFTWETAWKSLDF
jgi:glycosyltransferase involved in cell wall biosynthesis